MLVRFTHACEGSGFSAYLERSRSGNGSNEAGIIFLKELIETDRFNPVIDRTYPLEQIAEALAYVEKGKKKKHHYEHVIIKT